MKIDTLIDDIYNLLGDPNADLVFDTAMMESLGIRMANHVRDEIKDPDRSDRDPSTVYVTQITSNCPRKRWYEYNNVQAGVAKEKISGKNRFKFLYGDLIEESVLFLAELAGHAVKHRQERLTIPVEAHGKTYTLAGRIDAVIDDVLVDVKSMEGFTFDKFAKGEYEDKWGYGNQLWTYEAMLTQHVDDRMILGINKLNGRMHLAHLPRTHGFNAEEAVAHATNPKKSKVPADQQTTVTAGVKCLDTLCAYCPFKVDCFKDSGGLRVYAYSSGPKFVVGTPAKEPKVPEITEAWLKETHQ